MSHTNDEDSLGSCSKQETTPMFDLSNEIHKTCESRPSSRSFENSASSKTDCANRRGRPKTADIPKLILEGATSDKKINCPKCTRVFPNNKSLLAHMRTHSGEKPYICDFPECVQEFAQSGHLRTHQRLHTGEKPFICPVTGCDSRFTHSNRHCSQHPSQKLERERFETDSFDMENDNPAIRQWKEKYIRERGEPQLSRKQREDLKRKREQAEKDPNYACALSILKLHNSLYESSESQFHSGL